MARNAGQRPNVTAWLTEPRQERVAEAVQHKRTNTCQQESLFVLLLEARRLDVPSRGGRSPDPTL
jgi:hypothetical protein